MQNIKMNKEYYIKVGLVLRANRKHQKISAKEVAHKIGVSEQQISKYERGIDRIPMSIFDAYCRAVNSDIETISNWANNMKTIG